MQLYSELWISEVVTIDELWIMSVEWWVELKMWNSEVVNSYKLWMLSDEWWIAGSALPSWCHSDNTFKGLRNLMKLIKVWVIWLCPILYPRPILVGQAGPNPDPSNSGGRGIGHVDLEGWVSPWNTYFTINSVIFTILVCSNCLMTKRSLSPVIK